MDSNINLKEVRFNEDLLNLIVGYGLNQIGACDRGITSQDYDHFFYNENEMEEFIEGMGGQQNFYYGKQITLGDEISNCESEEYKLYCYAVELLGIVQCDLMNDSKKKTINFIDGENVEVWFKRDDHYVCVKNGDAHFYDVDEMCENCLPYKFTQVAYLYE